MLVTDLEDDPCSIARTAALFADPWTVVLLRQAFTGVRRFDDFQSSLSISPTTLAGRLNRLVDAGILEKHPYADARRTRQEYRLTEQGMQLYTVLQAMRAWGDRYLAPDGPFLIYTHRNCGGTAEVELACTQCGTPLTARDIALQTGPGWPQSHAESNREPARADARKAAGRG